MVIVFDAGYLPFQRPDFQLVLIIGQVLFGTCNGVLRVLYALFVRHPLPLSLFRVEIADGALVLGVLQLRTGFLHGLLLLRKFQLLVLNVLRVVHRVDLVLQGLGQLVPLPFQKRSLPVQLVVHPFQRVYLIIQRFLQVVPFVLYLVHQIIQMVFRPVGKVFGVVVIILYDLPRVIFFGTSISCRGAIICFFPTAFVTFPAVFPRHSAHKTLDPIPQGTARISVDLAQTVRISQRLLRLDVVQHHRARLQTNDRRLAAVGNVGPSVLTDEFRPQFVHQRHAAGRIVRSFRISGKLCQVEIVFPVERIRTV